MGKIGKWETSPCEFCERPTAKGYESRHHPYCDKNPIRLPRQRRMVAQPPAPIRYVAPQPTPEGIQVRASVRVGMDDLAQLQPAQLEAFMGGVARVVIAQGSNNG